MLIMGFSDNDAVSNPNGNPNEASPDFYQNVVVMRHGDRMDNFDRSWLASASRPWDPPLFDRGLVRALDTGRTFLNVLGFPIHRVFVSPFLRCVQTAAQLVSALCTAQDVSTTVHGDAVAIDLSKLKVSIEYGLCEMLSSEAIKPDLAPKDGNWGFNISELEAMFPIGTVDHSVERVYNEMPPWEGTAAVTRRRYEQVFQTLTDKYPSENLLLVTHGEGVGVAVSSFMKDTLVYGVEYCAYAELRRPVFHNGDSFTFGKFEVLMHDGLNGIKYMTETGK